MIILVDLPIEILETINSYLPKYEQLIFHRHIIKINHLNFYKNIINCSNLQLDEHKCYTYIDVLVIDTSFIKQWCKFKLDINITKNRNLNELIDDYITIKYLLIDTIIIKSFNGTVNITQDLRVFIAKESCITNIIFPVNFNLKLLEIDSLECGFCSDFYEKIDTYFIWVNLQTKIMCVNL